MGRPELDLLTILVRESAQNSWDARQSDEREVEYRLDLRTIGPAHISSWRNLLQDNAPLDRHLPLRPSLRQGLLRILTVSDRGTDGLGGPTRADSVDGSHRDFVSFVRNIGEPRDTEFGGGTYGFGKGIFYLLSKPGTILVHTRCRTDQGFETRLIGCSLWKSYVAADTDGEKRYTGRHWWGDVRGEVVEPLVGPEAEEVARRLGLAPFDPDETGTDVLVIDPDLDDSEPIAAAQYLADTIVWHLWPKMLATKNGHPAMSFSVSCEGNPVPVPDPRVMRPLNLFVEAYEQMVGENALTLECFSPKKVLGRLGLKKAIAPAFEPTPAGEMIGVENLVHHVCLMRPAELVVSYHSGPKPPSELLAYAGVFKADRGMDEIYASSEPPTHDGWNAQSLGHPEITYVRTTFKRIRESLDGLLELGGTARPGGAQVALGAASGRFASLVGGAWGFGGLTDFSKVAKSKGGPVRGGRGGGRSAGGDNGGSSTDNASDRKPVKRPRVEYLDEPYLDERAGVAVVVQSFRLPVVGRQTLTAEVAVALSGEGARETDPPVGADRPAVLGWENEAGDLVPGATCSIDGGTDLIWRALARPVQDTVTEIAISARMDQVES